MKISKLFHWLYALVMLLPIFAIGVTCGYAIFNKNAYLSNGDMSVQNTTLVTNSSQLFEGGTYIVTYSSEGSSYSPIFTYKSVSVDWYELGASNQYTYNGFRLNYNNIQLYVDNTMTTQFINFVNLEEFSFTFKSISQELNNNTGHSKMYLITFLEGKLSDVFYYSIDRIQESPLFNWAENSFLVTPFAYIVNLFSMPSNSVIVMLLSYWLAISIIWLVFDLIMYVPLLVHRWIDKGMIE